MSPGADGGASQQLARDFRGLLHADEAVGGDGPQEVLRAGGGGESQRRAVGDLDEVQAAAAERQVRDELLHRVLEAREFQRLGGAKVLKADVRIVAATNRDLHAAMARGDFSSSRTSEPIVPPLLPS